MNDLQMTNQDLSQRQSMEELANQLTLADHLVYKKLSAGIAELFAGGAIGRNEENAGCQDLHQAVPDEGADPEKTARICSKNLSTVYHSSMALGCSLAVMIDVPADGAPADIYLGVRQNPGRQSIDNRDLQFPVMRWKKG